MDHRPSSQLLRRGTGGSSSRSSLVLLCLDGVLLLLLLLLPACSPSAADSCLQQAERLCLTDPNCHAIGLHSLMIQLHGCSNATTPNPDWTLYARLPNDSFVLLPSGVDIVESGCSVHPRQMDFPCNPPPPPPKPYTVLGSIDVLTFENSLFYWNGTMYVLENIACPYWWHAGVWDPTTYGNVSYGRIRDLQTGQIVANLSSSVGFGFLSPFPDYEHGTMWIFGVEANRCTGNGNASVIYSWSSKDLKSWDRHLAWDFGIVTFNVQVTRVGALPGAKGPAVSRPHSPVLPPHRYAMIVECFYFAVNNNEDGNLTYGWTLVDSKPPPAPCGGPAMYYNPADSLYYVITGGDKIHLLRTADFLSWNTSKIDPFIEPSAGDGLVADLAGFPAWAKVKGSPPNKYVGVPEPYDRVPFLPDWQQYWQAWSQNSNDADVCCMHGDVDNITYFIWGASTQGGPPQPPLTGTVACTNVVAKVDGAPLWQVLSEVF
jgi:hypothetical protein